LSLHPHHQIANDITQKTPASFEPSIDYIVTKIPKFAFEKFKGTKAELTTQVRGSTHPRAHPHP
jgi:carbamoyl-phosphate synthase large subunit